MPIRRPRFKSHLELRAVAGDVVFVKQEGRFEAINSRLYSLLVPFIDGCNTREDIARLIGGPVNVLDVQFGLEELAQSGYILDATEGGPATADEEFCDALGIEGPALKERLVATRTAIFSLSAIDSAPLVCALEELGMGIHDAAGNSESTIDVLIVDDYLDSRIDAHAVAARNADRPLLLAKPAGTMLWLGPVIQPPRTTCWPCLAARLRERQAFRIQRDLGKLGIRFEVRGDRFLPSTLQIAWSLIATELWKWAGRGGQSGGVQNLLDDVILTFDLRSLELQKHFVTRRDHCSLCGQGPASPDDLPVPIRLEKRRKLFTADGGHRAANPETVYQRVARHISPITGIVSQVQPAIADSSAPLQVYWADHNHEFGHSKDPVEWVVPHRSCGKGMSATQARTGAVCEALERYSAIFRGDEIRRMATFAELGDSAIHPNQCMLFSQTQYDNRDEWNRKAAPANWVPMPFDETRPAEWSALWSLTHGTFRYLPTAMCYFAYPAEPGHSFCRADSNGLAAGSNLEEAVLQGFLELIERDSVAMWWYNQVSRPAVDLASFRHPYFDRLAEYYAAESRDLWTLDLTGPFPVPVMAAISARKPPEPADFLFGFGCHLDPGIAVARALTELNQLVALGGSPRKLIAGESEATQFLAPAPGQLRGRQDFPEYRSDDLRQDVEYLTGLAAARGLEPLLLNQTRNSVGLDVARIVVPGLRPFYARFAPGRLYNVPVEIGWLKAPSTEAEMNPCPLVF
jgi:ribosomal protein S12 methylthiotransferase accessory factor